jgi:hypothetical protein
MFRSHVPSASECVGFPLPTRDDSESYHPSHTSHLIRCNNKSCKGRVTVIIATSQCLHYRRNEHWKLDAFNLTFRVHLHCLFPSHFSPFLFAFCATTTRTHSLISVSPLPPFFCHYNSGYRSMYLKPSGPSKNASH